MNDFNHRATRLQWMPGSITLCLILIVLAVVPVGATEVGSALAAGETATLAFFTPVEVCRIRYCLTADLVAERVNAAFPGRVNVVEVPVTVFHMPTQFGWGPAAPQMILVDGSGRVLHDFGDTLDMEILARVLDGG